MLGRFTSKLSQFQHTHEDTIRLQSEREIKGAVKLCNRKTSVMMSLDYLH